MGRLHFRIHSALTCRLGAQPGRVCERVSGWAGWPIRTVRARSDFTTAASSSAVADHNNDNDDGNVDNDEDGGSVGDGKACHLSDHCGVDDVCVYLVVQHDARIVTRLRRLVAVGPFVYAQVTPPPGVV